jgi:hypothetical protein
MIDGILSLRISRRAIAAVVLEGDELRFRDGRCLNSRRDRAERSAESYVERLVAQLRPRGVMIYAPNTDEGMTSGVLRVVQTTIVRAGISLRLLTRQELLNAFAVPPMRHWREVREVVQPYWPQLSGANAAALPFIVDAAAVALYSQALLAFMAPNP